MWFDLVFSADRSTPLSPVVTVSEDSSLNPPSQRIKGFVSIAVTLQLTKEASHHHWIDDPPGITNITNITQWINEVNLTNPCETQDTDVESL